MDNADVFAFVAALRPETADFVESLDAAQLATPSLCGKWDVRTVAAHLTVLPTVSRVNFVVALVRHRGSFDRANDALSCEAARQPVAKIAERLRTVANSTAVPPVGGPRAPLTDLLVHNGDMRIPLGLPFDPPLDAVEIALGFLTGTAVGFVPRGRLAGIALAPTDSPKRYGSGAELTGRAADLIMAATGRAAVLDALGGPGKDLLATRLRASSR